MPAKSVVIDLQNKEIRIEGEPFPYAIAEEGWNLTSESDALVRVTVTFFADAAEVLPLST